MTSPLSSDLAQFGLNLLKEVGGASQDVLISPLSISMALGMTLAGAEGKTAEQLRSAMFPSSKDAVHKAFKDLLHTLFKPDQPAMQIRTANRLYVAKQLEIYDEFTKSCQDNYNSSVKGFSTKQPTEVRLAINKWVADETNGKIVDLLPEGIIGDNSKLLLINVIYFKGMWKFPFEPSLTSPQPFYSGVGQKRTVQMMSLPGQTRLAYRRSSALDCQLLGLPYKGDRLFFCIFLPNRQFGLADLMSKVTVAKMLWGAKMADKNATVNVVLPRLKLNWGGNLTENLKRLGIADLFDLNLANLSGITNVPTCVTNVIHKTFMEVNEEGTEAAAATAVLMSKGSKPKVPKCPTVRVDHPFLHSIIDIQSGQILFLGTTFNPE